MYRTTSSCRSAWRPSRRTSNAKQRCAPGRSVDSRRATRFTLFLAWRPIIMARGRVAGRAGEQQQLGSDWIGWSGKVAHPDAPMGGGGPGFFDDGKGLSPDGAGSRDGDRLASPSRPGPMNDLNDNTVALKAPKPANPPPATKARSLGSQRSVQSTHVDVEITAAVKADGTGGPTNGAHTDFTMPGRPGAGLRFERRQDHQVQGQAHLEGQYPTSRPSTAPAQPQRACRATAAARRRTTSTTGTSRSAFTRAATLPTLSPT